MELLNSEGLQVLPMEKGLAMGFIWPPNRVLGTPALNNVNVSPPDPQITEFTDISSMAMGGESLYKYISGSSFPLEHIHAYHLNSC